MKKLTYITLALSAITSYFTYSMEKQFQTFVDGRKLQFNAEQTLQALQTCEMLKTAQDRAEKKCSEKIEEQLSPEKQRILELERQAHDLQQAIADAKGETRREQQELRMDLIHTINRVTQIMQQQSDAQYEQFDQKYELHMAALYLQLDELQNKHTQFADLFQQVKDGLEDYITGIAIDVNCAKNRFDDILKGLNVNVRIPIC